MEKVLQTFLDNFTATANRLGLNLSLADAEEINLNKSAYIVFEISYFGHIQGCFRAVLSKKALNKFVEETNDKDSSTIIQLFKELMLEGFNGILKQNPEFEYCTTVKPRVFQSPLYEESIPTASSSLKDNNTGNLINVFFLSPNSRTDLSKVLEEQQQETKSLSLKAKQLEEEKLTMSNQKFEAIGQLAAGVAHEINTPIQFVSDNLNFLTDSFNKIIQYAEQANAPKIDYYKEEIPSALSESLEGINRIAEIVKSLKEFSHPGNDKAMEYSARKLIENSLSLTKNEWKYLADVDYDVEDKLIKIYPNELSQVLVNMIVNSAHSIKDKFNGRKEGQIYIRFYQQHDLNIIEIEDNGGGIPEAYLESVFNPFFTTKEIGKGTGQGLAISKKIVEINHDGEIKVTKNSPEGVCFKLILGNPKL